MGRLVVLLFLLVMPNLSHAFCYEQAGAEFGVSPELLESIATTESANRSTAVNYNTNATFDVGLMQINSSWETTIGNELWSRLFDPCTNVRVGAWILAQCIRKHGYGWKAVGCYHSSTPSKRDAYSKKVAYALVHNRQAHQKYAANISKQAEITLISAAGEKSNDLLPWDSVFAPVEHVR